MWTVLEIVLVAAVVLLAITEFFYPLLAGKPLFGSFRKARPKEPPTLEDELTAARRKVEEVRELQRKAEAELRKAEDRKDRTDDLLR